jgi:hypothetical protein
MPKSIYHVEWTWLDGRNGRSIPFTNRRDAEACARRYRNVALIRFSSVIVVKE